MEEFYDDLDLDSSDDELWVQGSNFNQPRIEGSGSPNKTNDPKPDDADSKHVTIIQQE